MKYNKLTPFEQKVILFKATERPWSGEYVNHKEDGTYTCKQCNAPLFRSTDKFDSHCGWPSFDDEIPGAVKRVPDADGIRTEIVCANCSGHLGHVFKGEGFTDKNIRHCVNSVSLNFIPLEDTPASEEAIFASGCFWGTEYYFQKVPGVISTTVGYIGGRTKSPTYQQVCSGKTGHKEAVQVIFDPAKTSFEELAKLFFETHDFTQTNGQGPDIGEQYLSYIFFTSDEQKEIAQKLVNILEEKGYDVATKLEKATEFYKAENYHQDYYQNNGKKPYCHFKRDVF
ncbi:MAG: bifunctional methionine sulfoxide reductase B/A protein [Candidatus Marinimicrobia bacterium]|nr:bifunctional methionine sulfoxide reductase B/A protein [Candidatus Neomarinimicrobiota bacterium]